MRPVNDPGFDKNRGRYLPRTMRTAARDPIPQKQNLDPQWAVQCQDQAAPLWGLKTPSGLNFSLVSASFQGAIRQGRILESLQWALEMARTDAHLFDPHLQPGGNGIRKVSKGESNFWTRAFVIAAEDISLANPYVIVTMAEFSRNLPTFRTQDEAEHTIMQVTLILAQSMKSRVGDWACICRIPLAEDNQAFDNVLMFQKLLQCLVEGNHVLAMGYMESFIMQSLTDEKDKVANALPKALFSQLAQGVLYRGAPVKHYTNRRQLLWVALLKSFQYISPQGEQWPTALAIVEACYTLAHNDKFRWKVAARLFGRMAALAICLRTEVEKRGLLIRNGPIEEMPLRRAYTIQKLEQLRIGLMGGNLWYGVSDVCKDKHTLEGKQLGRDIQHFVEVKAWLRHEDPTLSALSDYYLKLCFETRFIRDCGQNAPFGWTGAPIDKYIEWLPELRCQHDTFNRLEDLMYKQTVTITFGENVESFVGMEQLGKMAPEGGGFTCAELLQIGKNFQGSGVDAEYYDLRQCLLSVPQGDGSVMDRSGEAEEAGLLILRNVVGRFVDASQTGDVLFDNLPTSDLLLLELLGVEWDKKAFMKGRVVNKIARHNIVVADFERGPDYEKKQGTVVSFSKLPRLRSVREKLGGCFGPKAANLLAEGNHYYDADSCFIGYHGDFERRIVIGLRLGCSMPLEFQWHQNTDKVGLHAVFVLNHSDIYLMSQKAVGTDWKKQKILTLRHAANSSKAK